MTEEIDVYRAAALLVKQYGENAPIRAAMRADELCAAGDVEGAAVWKRILRAIDKLQTKERPTATKLH